MGCTRYHSRVAIQIYSTPTLPSGLNCPGLSDRTAECRPADHATSSSAKTRFENRAPAGSATYTLPVPHQRLSFMEYPEASWPRTQGIVHMPRAHQPPGSNPFDRSLDPTDPLDPPSSGARRARMILGRVDRLLSLLDDVYSTGILTQNVPLVVPIPRPMTPGHGGITLYDIDFSRGAGRNRTGE